MTNSTYRGAIYSTRIMLHLPRSIGRADLVSAVPSEGGVLFTLKAHPNGRMHGSVSTYGGHAYECKPPEGTKKLPRIGLSQAQLRKGLTEDGILELWVPIGEPVARRVRRSREELAAAGLVSRARPSWATRCACRSPTKVASVRLWSMGE